MIKCSACPSKTFHLKCYLHMIQYYKIPHHFENRKDMQDIVLRVCGKKCYNVLKRLRNKKNDKDKHFSSNRWHKDNITADGPTSLSILIDWISTEENARKYFGGKDPFTNATSSKTKTDYVKDVKVKIYESVNVIRTVDSIVSKISKLHNQYKQVKDWTRQTGAGLDKEGDDFKSYVLRQCPHFYHFDGVMSNFSSSKPDYTNEDESICSHISNDASDFSINDTDLTNTSHNHSSGGSINGSKNSRKRTPSESRYEAKKFRNLSRSGELNKKIDFELDADSKELVKTKSSLFKTQIEGMAKDNSLKESRLHLDERRFEMELQASKRAAKMEELDFLKKKSEHNLAMVRYRKEAKDTDSTITEDTLNVLWPFHT